MSKKKSKKEQAIKKAKQKKRIIIAVCAVALVAFIGIVVLAVLERSQERAFTDGNQTVILRDNGNFNASLAHNTNIRGTFTETDTGGEIIVSFVDGGTTVTGSISDGILHLPEQWRAGCGHGHSTELPLARGRN